MHVANALVFLLLSAIAGPLSPPSADLRVEHGDYSDPDPPGYYTYYVINGSEDVARNVRLTCDTPQGATFTSVYVNDERARCEAPTSGPGRVEVRLPELSGEGLVSLTFYLAYGGKVEAGTPAWMHLDVASDTFDPNLGNNAYNYENYVSYPPPRPVLESVRSDNDPNNGFQLRISGENFSDFSHVGIGCMCAPASSFASSQNELVVHGGKALRKQFPKGVPVQICVSNEYQDTAYISFTRQ